MPGFNQTGPLGDGPMTGRRMGKCTNYGAKGKAKDVSKDESQNQEITENSNEQVSESGRGLNFGFNPGGGRFGCGMGRRNRFRGGF